MARSSKQKRGALVSARGGFKCLENLRAYISLENLAHIERSCFGPILAADELKFQGQLFNVMCRRLEPLSIARNVLEYRVGNHLVEFGPADFATITGLSFSGSVTMPESSIFHDTVFGRQSFIHYAQIEKAFLKEALRCGGRSEKSLKLAYLVIVLGLLVLKDKTTKPVSLGYVHLVDNLDRFLRFPWGRIAYDFMVPRVHNAKKRIETMEKEGKKLTVEAYGFVHALQVWAYEVIPPLGGFCGKRVIDMEDCIPRILRWSCDNRLLFVDLWNFFLPSSGVVPVPLILSPLEQQMLTHLGIPGGVQTASPKAVFTVKTGLKRRRLEFEDAPESSYDVGKRKMATGVVIKEPSYHIEKMRHLKEMEGMAIGKGKEKVAGVGLRRSSRNEKKDDDVGTSLPPSPRLSQNDGEGTSHPSHTSCKSHEYMCNVMEPLIRQLLERIDSLHSKVDKLDGKVDTEMARMKERVSEAFDDAFQAYMFSPKSDGREDETAESPAEVRRETPGDSHASTPDHVPSVGTPENTGKNKLSPSKNITPVACLEVKSLPQLSPNVENLTQVYQPIVPNSADPKVVKKRWVGKQSMSAGCSYVRRSTRLASAMAPDSGEAETKALSLLDGMRFDPNDLDFILSEMTPYVEWKRLANSRPRRYDRRLPIKLLRIQDIDWFQSIERRQSWLDATHLDGLMFLLLNSFENLQRDWTCLQMDTWLPLMNDNVEKMVGRLQLYLRGSLPSYGGLEWSKARRVFGVAHINNNHWCFYEAILEEQKIVVYDSLNYKWEGVAEHFQHVRRNFPILCRVGRIWEKRRLMEPLKDSWDVEKYHNAPQQQNLSDCGIFAMKFMECRAHGVPLDRLLGSRGAIFRQRYVSRLFAASHEV